MLPTEMPSWWRGTTFCMATVASDGIGPKPAPMTTNVPLRAVNSLILNRGSALQITNSAVEGDNVFDVAGGTLTLADGWINCTNITVRVGRTNSTVGTLKLNGGLMQTFKLSVGSAVNSLGAQLGACTYCGFCEKFGCGNYSKSSPQTTVLPYLIHRNPGRLARKVPFPSLLP